MQPTCSEAILTPITEAGIFLTVTVDSGGEDGVRDLLSDVSGLRRSVGFRLPEGSGNLFIVPTVDFLDDPPTPATAALPQAEDAPSGDGPLGIGSLRGTSR